MTDITTGESTSTVPPIWSPSWTATFTTHLAAPQKSQEILSSTLSITTGKQPWGVSFPLIWLFRESFKGLRNLVIFNYYFYSKFLQGLGNTNSPIFLQVSEHRTRVRSRFRRFNRSRGIRFPERGSNGRHQQRRRRPNIHESFCSC